MRITGGVHRSRQLETPKNNMVRPTSDKVRQAIFNMLNSRNIIQDAVVIDAFCGTGALGLEALSQGAKFSTFFDKNKNSIQICKNNIENLKEKNRSFVQLYDVTKEKSKADNIEAACLVFLDPPYHQNLISKAVSALLQGGWIKQNATLIMEMAKDETLESDWIEIKNEKIYGDTKVLLGILKNTAIDQAKEQSA